MAMPLPPGTHLILGVFKRNDYVFWMIICLILTIGEHLLRHACCMLSTQLYF